MGKGNGDRPPQKFITDQCFCQSCILLIWGASVTLSSLSARMDDGGSFPYPYFFTGFVLGTSLLVNLISRWYVVTAVQKKGVTRKNIIDILNKTKCETHLAMVLHGCNVVVYSWLYTYRTWWCGENCGIDEKQEDVTANVTRTVRNTCYYDIEGEHAGMYKGLATPLVVVHVLSFAHLCLSNCPVHCVLDQIKEGPQENTSSPANTSPAVAPSAPPGAAPSAIPTANTIDTSANDGGGNEMEMKTTVQNLEARVRKLESREREIGETSVLPPPPSYNEIENSPGEINPGALPNSAFP